MFRLENTVRDFFSESIALNLTIQDPQIGYPFTGIAYLWMQKRY